jgi:GNAT superfamily N-acetyltransferase
VDVQIWDPANLGELANTYNTQVATSVPHCYAVSPQELGAGRADKTGDDYRSTFDTERLFVATRGGEVQGFAHVSTGEIVHREQRQNGGFVHMLTYAPGERDLGQALLDACEQHCFASGASTIWAFDGYAYRFHHSGFPLVSDRMGHVYSLFGQNGYKLAGEGELFLECLGYSVTVPPLTDPTVEVQVQIQGGRGERPNLTLQALRGETQLGSCVALSSGDYCRAPEAQDRVFVDGLGVADAAQGRGWGRYLLMRTLHQARQLGYRHAAISTGKRNYRAQLFYTNYGYRVTDTVYGFVKGPEHGEGAARGDGLS